MVYATLKDAASMTMGSNNNAIVPNTVKDELFAVSLDTIKSYKGSYLSVVWRQAIKTLLYDMIPIEVLNQLHHSVLQSKNDGLDLFGTQCTFYSWSHSTYLLTRRDELNHFL